MTNTLHSFRVLVCGGRDYTDRAKVWKVLNRLHADKTITLVIDGVAVGADTLGWLWAINHDVHSLRFPAQWKKYGRSAGPVRNTQMLDEGKPDLIIAFPGGRGTENMVIQATGRGFEVRRIEA